MSRVLFRVIAVTLLAVASPASAEARAGQNPDDQQTAKRRPPVTSTQRGRAVPRTPTPPPPRVLPGRFPAPRVYHFVPISPERGWFYHAYFGFYYGPYYGPFYPYPGPYYGHDVYTVASVRTRVEPRETRVYVDGYFAGEVDDFDGIFQRLYLPAGSHVLEFVLEGFETHRVPLFLNIDDSREIRHTMRRLAPAQLAAPPMAPLAHPVTREVRPSAPMPTARPSSPYGVLALFVDPGDAVIEIDGDTWVAPGPDRDLVVHLTAGWHAVRITKDGYQPFVTDIELSEGATTRLTVRLRR